MSILEKFTVIDLITPSQKGYADFEYFEYR